jgi:S1-C subfamily serine protease
VLPFSLRRDKAASIVEPAGPADKAGVMVGDYLVNASGLMPVQYLSLQDFEELSPGTVVQLTLKRGDKQLTVSLTLAAR